MNSKKRFLSLALVLSGLVSTLVLTTNASDSVKDSIGIVDASALRLRAEPNTSSEIKDLSYRGDYVVVLDQEGDWYKVIYNTTEGYMHGDYLTVKERENVELGYGRINTGLVNMRSEPSTSGDLVAQISGGEEAYIIGFNCGWYKVIYDDQVGYIRSDLLDLTEVPYANSGSSESPKYFINGDPISSIPSASDSDDSQQEDSYYEESEDTYYEDSEDSEDSYYEDSDSYYEDSDSSDDDEYIDNTSSAGDTIVDEAMRYLGVPYVWGGSSPSGFDCSGYVQYVMRACGYSINRTASAQLEDGYAVSYSNLLPGDLVFFHSTYDTDAPASHVGIYIGDDQFIHAGGDYVQVSNLSSGYYSDHYLCARRIG